MWWMLVACVEDDKGFPVVMEEAEDENEDQTENEDAPDTAVPSDSDDAEELSSEVCDDAYLLELSYVDLSANIWRYDLATQAIVELGTPTCSFNVSGDYMIAMTADSKGQLWMLSRYGDIYMVVPANLHCTYTGINFLVSGQFSPQGLAFMREGPESPDVLFVSGVSEVDLQAYLGVQNGNGVGIIGAIDGIAGAGNNIIDLAGTADGRLFGLRPSGTQSALTEITPGDASPVTEWMLDIPAPNGWSFVALFGEFWTFTSESGANTQVHWFDPETETLSHRDSLPFQTVGAALPTCAPESSGS